MDRQTTILRSGGIAVQGITGAVEEQNRLRVLASFEAWTHGAGSPFDLLADDASWTIEGRSFASKTYVGRETFMREVIRPFNARMSVGLTPTLRAICADGDRVVVFFDGRGTARDGTPYSNTYFWLFELHEGKVTRAFAMFDSIEFNDFWSRVSPAEQ
jgi:hypothetical protein